MNISSNLKYEITYKKVKNINLRIRRDGILAVSAPHNIPTCEIEKVINMHYERFYKAQKEVFEKQQILASDNINKNHIYIRGNKCDFKVCSDTKYSYSYANNVITLYYKNFEKDYEKMLKDIALKVFNELGKSVSKEMNLKNIEIEVKKFSACYGKNYGRKRIALNYKLIHLEDIYIKNILYHEYAHCLEMNHSSKFYDILCKYDANPRVTKKYISENLHKYC